jgi:hypothetical protein
LPNIIKEWDVLQDKRLFTANLPGLTGQAQRRKKRNSATEKHGESERKDGRQMTDARE